MSYAFLTIKREQDGYVVRRPRLTDVVGHALRSAFDESNCLPDDMASVLRKLDTIPHRLN